MREHRRSLSDCEPHELNAAGGRAPAAGAGLRRAVRAAVPVRDGRPPGADPRPGSGSAGTCTSSSTRPCAPPRSSSTRPAPSRAPGRSSPTSCPRSRRSICGRRCACRLSGPVPVDAGRAGERRAFAPGRVNLIGEHTDYNGGLALPFAIAEGVTVARAARPRRELERRRHARDAEASAARPRRARRVRARGTGARRAAGARSCAAPPASCERRAGRCRGAGCRSPATCRAAPGCPPRRRSRWRCAWRCSSSPREPRPDRPDRARAGPAVRARGERLGRARRTGLLDQLASLCGEAGQAVLIDFRTLEVELVPLRLGDWRLVVLDSGERHAHASSGYNDPPRGMRARVRAAGNRARCAKPTQRELARAARAAAQAAPRHVLGENERVRAAVDALQRGDLDALGRAARRLAREPARPLRGLHARGRGRRRAPARARAPPGRGSSAAASAAACSGCSPRASQPPAGRSRCARARAHACSRPSPSASDRPAEGAGRYSRAARSSARRARSPATSPPARRRAGASRLGTESGSLAPVAARAHAADRCACAGAARAPASSGAAARRSSRGSRRDQHARERDFAGVDEVAGECRERAPADREPEVAVEAPAGQLEVVRRQEQGAREHERASQRGDRQDARDADREPRRAALRTAQPGSVRSLTGACPAAGRGARRARAPRRPPRARTRPGPTAAGRRRRSAQRPRRSRSS